MLSEVEASLRPFDFAQGDFDPTHPSENCYNCLAKIARPIITNRTGEPAISFAAAAIRARSHIENFPSDTDFAINLMGTSLEMRRDYAPKA